MYGVHALRDYFTILHRIMDEKGTHDYQYGHLEVFQAEMVSLEIFDYIWL